MSHKPESCFRACFLSFSDIFVKKAFINVAVFGVFIIDKRPCDMV